MEGTEKEPKKTVQTILHEIDNQLKLLSSVVYEFHQNNYFDEKPADMLLAVHNNIQDIAAKLRLITADERLDALPAPEGTW